MKVSSFSKLFDHSIIRPDATKDDVLRFAETAVKLNTATLTVQPYYLRFAADLLNHSNVLYKSFEPVDDTAQRRARRPGYRPDLTTDESEGYRLA
jgi:hypothetical protein